MPMKLNTRPGGDLAEAAIDLLFKFCLRFAVNLKAIQLADATEV